MSSPEVLNDALRLSLEFGDHWLRPVDGRLRARHPAVETAEAREVDALCRSIHPIAFPRIGLVYHGKLPEATARAEIFGAWPWIDEENRAHLWSQGMYYAWHG